MPWRREEKHAEGLRFPTLYLPSMLLKKHFVLYQQVCKASPSHRPHHQQGSSAKDSIHYYPQPFCPSSEFKSTKCFFPSGKNQSSERQGAACESARRNSGIKILQNCISEKGMGKALWVLGLETQCITIPHYRKAHKHLALAETGCPAVKTGFFLFLQVLSSLEGEESACHNIPSPPVLRTQTSSLRT